MEEQYIQILEKTNQQLSLWTNPYGIMIGVLAILFTILTIVAAVIIYRQSKDYKERVQADREQYAKSINDFLSSQKSIIEQREKQANKVEEKIDKLLKQYENQLKESSKSQKVEIEKAIENLKEEKLLLSSTIGPLTVSPNNFNLATSVSVLGSSNHHTCKSCGFGFFVKKDWLILGSLAMNLTVTCPKCGSVDSI